MYLASKITRYRLVAVCMPGAEGVREAVGEQSEMTYIGRRQETVAQWVAL